FSTCASKPKSSARGGPTRRSTDRSARRPMCPQRRTLRRKPASVNQTGAGYGPIASLLHLDRGQVARVAAKHTQSTPPLDRPRHRRAANGREPSVVVEDRADAAQLGEQRVAAVAELVQAERLVGLPLAVAPDSDGDGLARLIQGDDGQRAGCGGVVAA